MRAGASNDDKTVLLSLLLSCLLFGTACHANPVFPEKRNPYIYLILNQTADLDGELVQPAFLLTIIRADSVAFREAERFEMRRLSDGAPFAWEPRRTRASRFFGTAGPRTQSANWLLADGATADGLGRSSLEPGETYEITVETGDRVIRGRATIPDTFSISVVTRDGQRVAVWPAVDGAAAYAVDAADTGELFHTFQTDTTFALDPAATALSVIAIDPQAYRYTTDDTARRAGIEGGLGVFGAIQRARWEP